MADEVWARLEVAQGGSRLLLGGDWTLRNASRAAASLPARDGLAPGPVEVDTSAVGAMDTSGAFLLSQWLRRRQPRAPRAGRARGA